MIYNYASCENIVQKKTRLKISILFIYRVTSEKFLLSDVIGLAYKWNLPIRNRPAQGVLGGNGTNQISLVFKDLLMDMKASHQDINAFSLTGRLKEVKKFSHLSDELKEVLFQESVIFVEKASRTLRENKKEIAMLNRQCQYNQELITANSSERSLSPREVQSTPTNGHRRSRTQDRFSNRSKIGLGDRLEVGQRRGDESIEPMSKVKDWKSAFELSLIKINEQKNSITKLSKLCLGALNAIDRLESNIESEKEKTTIHSEQKSSNEGANMENGVSIEKNSVIKDLNAVTKVIDIIQEKIRQLENKAQFSGNDLKDDLKQLVEQEISDKCKQFIGGPEIKLNITEQLNETPTFLELKQNLGKIFLKFLMIS